MSQVYIPCILFSCSALTPRRPRRLVGTLHLPHFTSRGDHRPCRLHPEPPNLHVSAQHISLPYVSLIPSCFVGAVQAVQAELRETKVGTPFTYQDIEHFVVTYYPSRSKSGQVQRSPISAHSSLRISLNAEFAAYRLREAGLLYFLKDPTVYGPAALSSLRQRRSQVPFKIVRIHS